MNVRHGTAMRGDRGSRQGANSLERQDRASVHFQEALEVREIRIKGAG